MEVIAHGGVKTLPPFRAQTFRQRTGGKAAQGRVEAGQAGARLLQGILAVIEGAAIMAGEDEKAQHLALIMGQEFAHGKKIAQRFGHLLVIHPHKAVVHPVPGKGTTGRLGLGDLIFVVRELQIGAATVDVKGAAQGIGRHGRALDMPAGTPIPPGRGPGRFAGLGRLPQGKIQGVALVLPRLHPRAHSELIDGLAGEAAIVGEAAHGIVDIAVGRRIGMAPGDELTNEPLHGPHMLRRPRFQVRRPAEEGRLVLVHGVDKTGGKGLDRLPALQGAADDLVVDIRDIAHIGHLQPPGTQVAHHRIKGHHHPRVAQMTVVVNGHTADIKAHTAG